MDPRTRTVLLVTFTLLAFVAAAPVADAAPPDLPPNHSGCGYFHWHSGQVLKGEVPGYHYHHCY